VVLKDFRVEAEAVTLGGIQHVPRTASSHHGNSTITNNRQRCTSDH